MLVHGEGHLLPNEIENVLEANRPRCVITPFPRAEQAAQQGHAALLGDVLQVIGPK